MRHVDSRQKHGVVHEIHCLGLWLAMHGIDQHDVMQQCEFAVQASDYKMTRMRRLTNSSKENMVRARGASGIAITTRNCMTDSLLKGTSLISFTTVKLLSR